MKHIYNYLPLLLGILLINCNSGRNSNKKQINSYSVKIDSLIQTTSPRNFNGIILITQKGKTKYSKTYGYSNFEDKTSISIKDNFRIQSNSKQITAVLILKEVEKGKIDLKSPIKKYLPDLKQTWANTVTVHQLLNMSSGIIGIDKPLIFEPGTEYKYSNPAYGLLGRIIENVTEKKYIQIANNLFEKLKMNNTYCYEMHKNQLINGYRVSNEKLELVKFNELGISEKWWKDFIPAGGIISNAIDLSIWDTKLHNGKILKPKTYNLMTSYNITGQHSAFGSEKIGYGYGVRIDDNKSIKIIGHAGKGLGFASIKFYIPEKDINVIVLENIYNEDSNIVYHFENEIRKIVLNSSLVK
ncbi:serine hydrolase domain-containing protein [Aquimarina aquimarini]|uniref:serine hydrolase domain-containing protein n=1 Tax=Aquimarina aquimarini TaxID=1191734 RepID=UPI000D5551F0|nr:serine hydrolase domain-containing protein [Aquimarina aquimarini]